MEDIPCVDYTMWATYVCAGLLVGQCAFVGHASAMYVCMYVCSTGRLYLPILNATSLTLAPS